MKPQENVLQRMEQHIIDWQETGDQRHVFLSCYRLMTANMLTAVEENRFHDKAWVNNLLHHFADYYFEALACYDCGEAVPEVWQQVHVATRQKKLHRLQQLMMGVNAHINYDLVLTLYDVLNAEWHTLSPEAQKIRYEDHCTVNDIISATIDKVQDEILEPNDPVITWIDQAFGRLDEYLLSRLISSWRQNVWENTQKMLATDSPAEREILRLEVERHVLHRGKVLSLGK